MKEKACLFLCMSTLAWLSCNAIAADKKTKQTPSQACIEVLRSNCNASQDEMLKELLKKLEIHGVSHHHADHPGNPPAFEALPKDKSGQVNWVVAETGGVIKPRDSLQGNYEDPSPKYYKDLMFIQVKVHIMADVVFPHGMHTTWLSCDSCHPKPFAKTRGGNKISMQEIVKGKWCGKCHGKVSFNPQDFTNCRRCHVLPKRPWGSR